MSGVWSECLWDTHPQLYSYCKYNSDFLKHCMDFLDKRSKIEEKYCKDLRKLAKDFKPKEFKKDDKVKFSVQNAMESMLGEIEGLANQHDTLRDNLTSSAKEIKDFNKEMQKEAQAIHKQIAIHTNELEKKKNELNSTKAQYDRANEDLQKARKEYELNKDNRDITKNEEERYKANYHNKESIFNDRSATLAKGVTDFNYLQSDTYNNRLPQQFKKYETLEMRFCEVCKAQFMNWANAEKESLNIQVSCAQSMLLHCDKVNANADIDIVLRITQSGLPVPADVEFEELSSGSGNGSHHGSNPNIDGKKPKNLFGTLRSKVKEPGPAQMRRKIENSLNAKREELAKAQKEKDGIEKMLDACTTNPAFNRVSIEENLQAVLNKMTILQEECNALMKQLDGIGDAGSGRASKPSSRPGLANAFDDEFQDESPTTPMSNSSNEAAASVPAPPAPAPPPPVGAPPPPAPPPPPPPQMQQQQPVQQQVTKRMAYDFADANMADSLTVAADEIVEFIRDEGDGWSLVAAMGHRAGEQGYVPTSFLEDVLDHY